MIRYRDATNEDAAAIAALHAESWRATYRGSYRDDFLDGPVYQDRLDVWTQRLSVPAPNQFVLLAEDDGFLVGFACIYGRDDERWGSLLDNLHVLRDRHGQGVGNGLMAEVARHCLTSYADCGLYLWVIGGNQQARRFYERLGATDVGGEVRVPSSGGGEPIEIRRYAWPAPVLVARREPTARPFIATEGA